jgi:hypothetical protein
MVITSPETVAIDKFELVYVKPPVLFEVGGGTIKAASPNVFVSAEKPDITLVVGFTVNVAVIVPDE